MGLDVTKNQHYIPQGILRNFSDDKEMIVEAIVDKYKIYKTNIRNAMSKRFMYEHEFLEVNSLEHYFQEYENTLKINVAEIINFLETYNHYSESLNILKKLISNSMKYFLMMYYRSNALFEEYGFADITINKQSSNSVFEMIEKLSSNEYLNNLASTICMNYKLAILKSEDKFLISDQFISTCSLNVKNRFFGVSNRQIGMKDIMILIPLSSKYYICYYHSSNNSVDFKEDINFIMDMEVGNINSVIINNSYGKCAGLNEEIVKEAIETYKWQSPASIIAGGFKNRPSMGATMKKELFFFSRDMEIWEFFLSHNWYRYKNLKRNDICICGSGMKYKRCCQYKYFEAKRMMDDIISKDNGSKYLINPHAITEKRISEFNMESVYLPV